MDGSVVFAPLVLAAVGGLLVWVVQYALRKEAERARSWELFGQGRGLAFVPRSGPWYAQKPARLEGRLRDVPVTVDTFVVSTGKSSTTYTRVTAQDLVPQERYARVYREGALGALGDLLGFQDVAVGDEPFDRACVVKADDEAGARELLHKPLRDALLRWLDAGVQGGSFVYDRGQIKLVWFGAEVRHVVLAAAVDAAVEAGAFRGVEPRVFR
ncbi:MAG: hypothetical protein HY909_10940 [Deltaproteobacteria bacterium]|nr:hypothetical protein [Deltaproteobacteria bacterium]